MQSLQELKAQIPTRKDESYKYTNLSKVLDKFNTFDFSATEASKLDFNLNSLKVDGTYSMFFLNGVLQSESDKTELEFLDSTESNYSYKSDYNFKEDFLVKMNSLETKKHTFKLSANKVIDKPIFMFHIIGSSDTHLFNQEISYELEKNCELNIVEVFINSKENSVFFNNKSQSTLHQNAKFTHIHHQDLNKSSSFGNSITAQVAKDANYKSFTTTLGSEISRTNIHIDINDQGAEATASGLYTLHGTQHSDVNSYIAHNAPHTESHQLYKGIMNNNSRGVFTGLIKVQKDAQLINSNQLNKNLLLTKGAHANSRPQLEIFADDVKCSHGSTTGQLSEQELFYFQSRGIREEKAKMMLARAYTYDVLLKIENKLIRNYLQNEITEKFENKAYAK